MIPFDDYPNTKYDYDLQAYDLCPRLVTCEVIVNDYTAIIRETKNQNYSGQIVDGKFEVIQK